jgi:putative Mg2+ transporter-C (MgtC) family protein
MDLILGDLGLGVPDARTAVRVVVRLIAALLAGAVIGLQREHSGKAAGLRTHMLVCFGTALFVVACVEAGMASDAMSRVIQGLVTGIGFLGAGAIIKLESTREIKGLTTAAGIWLTAAIGVTVGLGHLGIAGLAVLCAWLVLAAAIKFESRETGSDDRA